MDPLLDIDRTWNQLFSTINHMQRACEKTWGMEYPLNQSEYAAVSHAPAPRSKLLKDYLNMNNEDDEDEGPYVIASGEAMTDIMVSGQFGVFWEDITRLFTHVITYPDHLSAETKLSCCQRVGELFALDIADNEEYFTLADDEIDEDGSSFNEAYAYAFVKKNLEVQLSLAHRCFTAYKDQLDPTPPAKPKMR